MAEKTKVKLHLPGFYALRISPEMQALLDEHAAAIREERKHASLSKAVGGW